MLDFLSYIPNCIGSYTHDLYQAEALQITDKFEEQSLLKRTECVAHISRLERGVGEFGITV